MLSGSVGVTGGSIRFDGEVRGSGGTPPAEVRIDDDGEHVWVAVDWLRKTAQPAGDLDWVDRFDAMIAYAAGKNWVDDAGRHVRAHLSVEEAEGARLGHRVTRRLPSRSGRTSRC